MMEPLFLGPRCQAQKADQMERSWREARWCRTGPRYREQRHVAHIEVSWPRSSELESIVRLGSVPPGVTYLESESSGSSS
jgi:hypothetical protein